MMPFNVGSLVEVLQTMWRVRISWFVVLLAAYSRHSAMSLRPTGRIGSRWQFGTVLD